LDPRIENCYFKRTSVESTRQLANVENVIFYGTLFYKNPIKDHKNVKNMAEKNLTYSILGQDLFLFWSE